MKVRMVIDVDLPDKLTAAEAENWAEQTSTGYGQGGDWRSMELAIKIMDGLIAKCIEVARKQTETDDRGFKLRATRLRPRNDHHAMPNWYLVRAERSDWELNDDPVIDVNDEEVV